MKSDLMQFWYQALSSPFGISISTSDPTATRQKLYAVRKETRDIDLEVISICVSPFDPTKLWLVKRAKKTDDAK